MRRFLLTLFLLSTPAFATEPRAVAKAPATARTGTVVRIDTSGMVSDSGPLVRVWSGPDTGEAHYGADGHLIGFELSKPGAYTFVSVASGKGADGSPVYAATFVATQVTGDAPSPPTPTPPVPLPPVLPTPTPQAAPFTDAYRAYSGGMDAALLTIADDVTSGKIGTKQALLDALRAHSAPFSKAIDDLCTWKIDAAGKITDPVSLANAIRGAVRP